MTNVAGSAVAGSDCATATASGACATIFALADMRPGDTDEVNTVTITYRGTETVTVRLYASAIESPSSSSSASCTAPDPAAAVELRITSGGAVYPPSGYGDASDFASTYADLASALVVRASGASTDEWSDGDSATFTFAVHLSAAAGNDHQGCASAITFAWYAN